MNSFKTIATVAIVATALFPFCAVAGEIAHAVNAASVFSDRALVTRTGTAKLKLGKNEIIFSGIHDNIDLRSIRAGENLPEGVKVLGVSWERHVSKTIDNTKISNLETRLAELEKEKTLLIDERKAGGARLSTAQTYLTLLRKAIAEQSTGKAPADIETTWRTASKNLASEIDKIYSREAEIDLQLGKINEKITPLKKELNTIYGGGNARKTLNLIVTLSAEKEMEATIPVSYTTYFASWTPRYDARISEKDKTISLFYDGVIRQMTGESWDNVKLTLSTAQPQISAEPPRTRPIALSGKKVDPKSREFEQVAVAVDNDALTEGSGRRMAPTSAAMGNSKLEDALSSVRTQGASVTFDIAGTYSIKTGTEAHQVSIAEKTFANVELTYEAAPSLRNGIYLRANTKNETAYPILPGEVNIYRQSGFIGKSEVKYTPVGSPISFFAGTIDGLSSSVKEIDSYTESSGKFFSSSGSTVFGGETYTFANLTGTPRKVRVRSQIQVSEIDDIKISILEKPLEHVLATTPGYVLEKETGLLYWDVELPANSETQIVLSTKTEEK